MPGVGDRILTPSGTVYIYGQGDTGITPAGRIMNPRAAETGGLAIAEQAGINIPEEELKKVNVSYSYKNPKGETITIDKSAIEQGHAEPYWKFKQKQNEIKAEFERNNIRLNTGEYMSQAAYNKLSEQDKKKVNILGTEKFNTLLEIRQKGFERSNVKLDTGEYINKISYTLLSDDNKKLINQVGVDKFNETQKQHTQEKDSLQQDKEHFSRQYTPGEGLTIKVDNKISQDIKAYFAEPDKYTKTFPPFVEWAKKHGLGDKLTDPRQATMSGAEEQAQYRQLTRDYQTEKKAWEQTNKQANPTGVALPDFEKKYFELKNWKADDNTYNFDNIAIGNNYAGKLDTLSAQKKEASQAYHAIYGDNQYGRAVYANTAESFLPVLTRLITPGGSKADITGTDVAITALQLATAIWPHAMKAIKARAPETYYISRTKVGGTKEFPVVTETEHAIMKDVTKYPQYYRVGGTKNFPVLSDTAPVELKSMTPESIDLSGKAGGVISGQKFSASSLMGNYKDGGYGVDDIITLPDGKLYFTRGFFSPAGDKSMSLAGSTFAAEVGGAQNPPLDPKYGIPMIKAVFVPNAALPSFVSAEAQKMTLKDVSLSDAMVVAEDNLHHAVLSGDQTAINNAQKIINQLKGISDNDARSTITGSTQKTKLPTAPDKPIDPELAAKIKADHEAWKVKVEKEQSATATATKTETKTEVSPNKEADTKTATATKQQEISSAPLPVTETSKDLTPEQQLDRTIRKVEKASPAEKAAIIQAIGITIPDKITPTTISDYAAKVGAEIITTYSPLIYTNKENQSDIERKNKELVNEFVEPVTQTIIQSSSKAQAGTKQKVKVNVKEGLESSVEQVTATKINLSPTTHTELTGKNILPDPEKLKLKTEELKRIKLKEITEPPAKKGKDDGDGVPGYPGKGKTEDAEEKGKELTKEQKEGAITWEQIPGKLYVTIYPPYRPNEDLVYSVKPPTWSHISKPLTPQMKTGKVKSIITTKVGAFPVSVINGKYLTFSSPSRLYPGAYNRNSNVPGTLRRR